MLYRKGEVPEELKGRGIFQRFGGEMLFSPFGGPPKLINSDWKCKHCGCEWYYHQVVKEYNSHCPRCGKWVGIKGLKFNGVQKRLEEY